MDKRETNIKPTMKSYEVVGVRNIGVIVVLILISIIYNLFS
ncbi:hypothetical protein [Bacillus cereus]|nr:hypothetical protein [Bacillus cereus]